MSTQAPLVNRDQINAFGSSVVGTEMAAEEDGSLKVSQRDLNPQFDAVKQSRDMMLFEATITTTAGAFTAGDAVGSLLTITGLLTALNKTARLQQFQVFDTAGQAAALSIVFFRSNPSASTFTDNVAVTWNVADIPRVIGKASIAATDYVTSNTQSVGTASDRNCEVTSEEVGGAIYAVLITSGTPTYGAAASLQIKLAFQRD